jgi:hypothetical protein
MRKKIALLTCAVGLFLSSNVMAQDSLVEHLVKACETDIQSYCSQVTPGNGRMLHCMAAHEDKISGQCQYAFYQAATVLEQLATAVAYVASQCATDIETHCGDVAMGEGRILACLSENKAEVSDACNQAVSDTVDE